MDMTKILAELRRERSQIEEATRSLARLGRRTAADTKIVGELRREQGRIEDAILTLERLAYSRGGRRGRPPGSKKKKTAVAE